MSAWRAGRGGWHVTARDVALVEQEPCAGYTRLRLNLVRRGVGDFTLELPSAHPAVDLLIEPGAGIVVRPDGQPDAVASGRVVDAYLTEGGQNAGSLTVVGLTDETVLARSLAFPDTTTDVSTSTTTTGLGHDVRSGPAETVLLGYVAGNVGAAAGIVRRRYPWLTVPASLGRGGSGTWRERGTTLLDVARRVAAFGELEFRIVQAGAGELELQVWEAVDQPEAKFTIARGSLTSAVLTVRAPDVDEVIVAGSGEDTARLFTRRVTAGSAAAWGIRSERFVDARNTDDLAELQKAGDEALVEGATTAGVKLYAAELPTLRYGVHYKVGDVVYPTVRGQERPDVVEQVLIEDGPSVTRRVTPSVGLSDVGESTEQVPAVRELLRNTSRIVRS